MLEKTVEIKYSKAQIDRLGSFGNELVVGVVDKWNQAAKVDTDEVEKLEQIVANESVPEPTKLFRFYRLFYILDNNNKIKNLIFKNKTI